MKKIIFITILFISTMLNLSHAKGSFRFGTDGKVEHLMDITGKDGAASEEKTYLGYYTETEWFGLGVGVEDLGYVIGIKGEDKFLPVTPEMHKIMHEKGLLPEILPKYEIPMIEYIFGYSLYIFIIGMLLFSGVKYIFRERR